MNDTNVNDTNSVFVVQHMYNDTFCGTSMWVPQLSRAKFMTLEGAQRVVKQLHKNINDGKKYYQVMEVSLTLNSWNASLNSF